FAAGEIGHMIVQEDPENGELCDCGRRGCIETIFGVPALRRDTEGLGPEETEAALRSAGERLGIALIPVVSTLNLREIRVSGPAQLFDGALLDSTLQTIQDRTLASVSEHLEIRMASLGDDAVLMGAAVLVLSGQLGVS
ncbi:MAG TPA: ROK family protein, partial [Actinomycetales bacterium]|nr:ROK family protein [Actinomycetales bacterium]